MSSPQEKQRYTPEAPEPSSSSSPNNNNNNTNLSPPETNHEGASGVVRTQISIAPQNLNFDRFHRDSEVRNLYSRLITPFEGPNSAEPRRATSSSQDERPRNDFETAQAFEGIAEYIDEHRGMLNRRGIQTARSHHIEIAIPNAERRPIEGTCGICLQPLTEDMEHAEGLNDGEEPTSSDSDDSESDESHESEDEDEEDDTDEESEDNDESEDSNQSSDDDDDDDDDEEDEREDEELAALRPFLEPEESNNDDIVWCQVSCGSNFHRACLYRWLEASERPSCPICRALWIS